MGTSPEEFKAFVGEEIARWKQVITAADIKVEERLKGGRCKSAALYTFYLLASFNLVPCGVASLAAPRKQARLTAFPA